MITVEVIYISHFFSVSFPSQSAGSVPVICGTIYPASGNLQTGRAGSRGEGTGTGTVIAEKLSSLS